MTVSSTTNRKTFAGNGSTTSFATSPMTFYDSGDLDVYVVNDTTNVVTTLVEGTGYTVSGGDGSTGTIDLSAGGTPHGAPASGTTLVIARTLSLTQATDLVQNDASDANVLEAAFDRLTMMVQQVARASDNALRFPDSDTSGQTAALPNAVGRANTVMGYDANGDLQFIPVPTFTPLSVRTVTATSYTLVAGDDQNVVHMANGGTVTVPNTLTVGHMTGLSSGSGAVAVVASGGASVVKAARYDAELAETNSFATVLLRSSGVWHLFGDLTLA